jgi:hypothetical protein
MLSIPRSSSSATDAGPSGILGMFSPKRNQEVISREAAVAERESEVARREADLLQGVPAGVTIGTCAPCPPQATSIVNAASAEPVTIIREIVKEVESVPPPWYKDSLERVEDVLEREARVTEREKEVGRREEIVGKRESDASRRETWIMENLVNDPGVATEEYVTYEEAPRRPASKIPVRQPPPPVVVTETETKTVVMPAPTNTRIAAQPSPQITSTASDHGFPTTVVEIVVEEETEPAQPSVTLVRKRTPPQPQAQKRWF